RLIVQRPLRSIWLAAPASASHIAPSIVAIIKVGKNRRSRSMSVASAAPVLNLGSVDRYESTFVVSQDPTKGDFTLLQAAINALPASGGKIFVKAGVYKITSTIQIRASNVHIQGEGMGITVFVADRAMTGNTPALEAFSTAADGAARGLIADTARGDTTIRTTPADASSFVAADYILLYSKES